MVLSFGGKHLKRLALMSLVLIKMLSLIPPLLMVLRLGAMLFFAYLRRPYRAFFYSCPQFHGCKCCKCTFVLQISFFAPRLALDQTAFFQLLFLSQTKYKIKLCKNLFGSDRHFKSVKVGWLIQKGANFLSDSHEFLFFLWRMAVSACGTHALAEVAQMVSPI